MAKVLLKGNEALAEAALAAGCRFYSGYPITPQTEILEYLSWSVAQHLLCACITADMRMHNSCCACGSQLLCTNYHSDL